MCKYPLFSTPSTIHVMFICIDNAYSYWGTDTWLWIWFAVQWCSHWTYFFFNIHLVNFYVLWRKDPLCLQPIFNWVFVEIFWLFYFLLLGGVNSLWIQMSNIYIYTKFFPSSVGVFALCFSFCCLEAFLLWYTHISLVLTFVSCVQGTLYKNALCTYFFKEFLQCFLLAIL